MREQKSYKADFRIILKLSHISVDPIVGSLTISRSFWIKAMLVVLLTFSGAKPSSAQYAFESCSISSFRGEVFVNPKILMISSLKDHRNMLCIWTIDATHPNAADYIQQKTELVLSGLLHIRLARQTSHLDSSVHRYHVDTAIELIIENIEGAFLALPDRNDFSALQAELEKNLDLIRDCISGFSHDEANSTEGDGIECDASEMVRGLRISLYLNGAEYSAVFLR